MSNTKSSKKALIVALILTTIGVYFTYDYFNQNSESKSIDTLQSTTDQVIEDKSTVDSEEKSTATESTPQVVLASTETVVEPTTTETTASSNTKNTLLEKSVAKNVVSTAPKNIADNKESLAKVVKKVDVKSPDQLVKTDEYKTLAQEKIEKVVIDNSSDDPFNLIISSEVKDSGIFEKYDYGIYINSVKQSNGKIVDGRVQVYDNVRSKKITTINTHTLAGVNDPKNRQQSIRVISTVFGYRPQEISFSLNEPSNYVSKTEASVSSVSDSVIRVDLRLERLQAGDIAVMWKVFFFKDAAIMQSKSKPELEDLHTMMKENPKMRIKLHGHTNGNSHGKVIHLGESDNDDLFNIKSEKHVETMGTAQKLSLYRAETIEHYLLSKGVSQSRIEIKGWGGKKMLYDKHSTQANLNVRVEVEILEN